MVQGGCAVCIYMILVDSLVLPFNFSSEWPSSLLTVNVNLYKLSST